MITSTKNPQSAREEEGKRDEEGEQNVTCADRCSVIYLSTRKKTANAQEINSSGFLLSLLPPS